MQVRFQGGGRGLEDLLELSLSYTFLEAEKIILDEYKRRSKYFIPDGEKKPANLVKHVYNTHISYTVPKCGWNFATISKDTLNDPAEGYLEGWRAVRMDTR